MLKQILVPIVLILALLAFYDPFMVLMPTAAVMLALGIFVVAAFLFALFIWNEEVRDEREAQHRLTSSRTAFVAGTSVLALAVVYQVTTLHSVDPWIMAALGVMVMAKTWASLHSSSNH